MQRPPTIAVCMLSLSRDGPIDPIRRTATYVKPEDPCDFLLDYKLQVGGDPLPHDTIRWYDVDAEKRLHWLAYLASGRGRGCAKSPIPLCKTLFWAPLLAWSSWTSADAPRCTNLSCSAQHTLEGGRLKSQRNETASPSSSPPWRHTSITISIFATLTFRFDVLFANTSQGAHGGLAEHPREGVDRGLHPSHRRDRRVRCGAHPFPARAPGARHARSQRQRDVRRRRHLAPVLFQGWRVVRSSCGPSPPWPWPWSSLVASWWNAVCMYSSASGGHGDFGDFSGLNVPGARSCGFSIDHITSWHITVGRRGIRWRWHHKTDGRQSWAWLM